MSDFIAFRSIPRLMRDIIVTEKIDGTNAQVHISDDGVVRAGSRTRWITPEDDNFGFATWVREHEETLRTLGPGAHFGEWWGSGIQRKYGLSDRRFSLFNTKRWSDSTARPSCCDVVPVLYEGPFSMLAIDACFGTLAGCGSVAAPGFMKPEGIVVFHVAANQLFKRTLDGNDGHKGHAHDSRSKA